MPSESTGAKRTITDLVDAYWRRACPAVLDQHKESSIFSPLGIWLLLALSAGAAEGDRRAALEETLGCGAPEAAEFVRRFLQGPPEALKSALALWVRSSDRSSPLVKWSATLPEEIERGPIPTQEDADRWADRNTMGLIQQFPLKLTPLTRVVLVSALATKVSWTDPFEVVPANGYLGPQSPWRDRVSEVLLDRHPGRSAMLARTEAAGVVAVHFAQAIEDFAVVSIAADPSLDRLAVFEAAAEIVSLCREDNLAAARCSLFELPLGRAHSWDISEHEVPASTAGERREVVDSAVLAAWTLNGQLDLTTSELFGVGPALLALLNLIGPSPEGDELRASQSTIASFSPYGFEAAALDIFSIATRGIRSPKTETGVLRRAALIFDHPYVAVAVVGNEIDFGILEQDHQDMFCLPLFAAWVSEPSEPRVN